MSYLVHNGSPPAQTPISRASPMTYRPKINGLCRSEYTFSTTSVISRVTDVMSWRLKMGNSQVGCCYQLRRGKYDEEGHSYPCHNFIKPGARRLRLWRRLQQQ